MRKNSPARKKRSTVTKLRELEDDAAPLTGDQAPPAIQQNPLLLKWAASAVR
jgi:hypothetical protein